MEVNGQLHAWAALPQGKDPGTHWVERWVVSRTCIETVAKKKISMPLPGIKPCSN